MYPGVDLSRVILVELLELLATDPELRERVRTILGVDAAHAGPAYVTRNEAREMGVEVRALVRAGRSGSLPAFRVGRSTVYRLGDVEKFVEAHPVAPVAPAREPLVEEPADAWERALARRKRRTSGRT
jgi:hypothetical protein